jgi:hypothetical protein
MADLVDRLVQVKAAKSLLRRRNQEHVVLAKSLLQLANPSHEERRMHSQKAARGKEVKAVAEERLVQFADRASSASPAPSQGPSEPSAPPGTRSPSQ